MKGENQEKMCKPKNVFLFFLSFMLVAGVTLAQAPTGKIIGKVVDDQSETLPGVTVEATSDKLIGKATATTDYAGIYRLLALPSGYYTITYTLPGFNTVVRKGIAVRLEETIAVDITLEPGRIEEEVTVIGESPLVDVRSTVKGMTLTKEMFTVLPRGRNFDTLVTAVAGVNYEAWAAGLSVDGASGAENMYYIDGQDITNMYGGTRGQVAVFEFVDEVQIKASGYPAEYGGSMGGVINVVTRAGGNEYHGELLGYYDSSMLQGKERDTLRLDPLDQDVAEYVNYQDLYGKDKRNQYEFGFNLGGYILKDKLWFYASALPVLQDTTRSVHWIPEGTAPDSDHTTKDYDYRFQAKLTAMPFAGMRLSASFLNNFSKYRGRLPGRDGTGNPDEPWSDYGYDYPNWSANLSMDYTVGASFLINARGGYFYTNTTNEQVGPPGVRWRFLSEAPGYINTTNTMFPEIPADYVHGLRWSNMSQNPNALNKDMQNRLHANLDMTLYASVAGEHAWKWGIQMVRIEQDIDNTAAYEIVYLGWDMDFNFLSGPRLGDTDRGTYGYYGVRSAQETSDHPAHPYGTFANPHSFRWALYLQDSWTPDFLGDRLTFNIGIRGEKEDIPSFSDLPEFQYPPVSFHVDQKLAPRLGFIYDVFGDASLKVYGSFGLYYDVMKLNMAVGSYGGLKWTSDYYTLDDWDFTQIGNGNYPGRYLQSYNWRIPSFDTTDTQLKPTSQSELTFGVEKMIMENLSASVRVAYKHVIRTIEDVGVQTEAGEKYFTANPGFGWTRPESEGGKFLDIYPSTPKAKREYWAVNFNLDKRFSNNWLAGFSYTWSRLWGNYGGLASSDEWGRNDPNVERYWDLWWHMWDRNMEEIVGLLNTDRTHQFKFYGSYVFPWGLTVGIVANGMSGIPVTRELHTGLEGYYPDGRATDGRSPFLTWANLYAEYNLKLGGRYRIQFSVNVDNLFDIKTARRIYYRIDQQPRPLTDDERLAGWDYNLTDHTTTTYTDETHSTVLRTISWRADPRFLMEEQFYPPISVRFGMKFRF